MKNKKIVWFFYTVEITEGVSQMLTREKRWLPLIEKQQLGKNIERQNAGMNHYVMA